MADAQDPNPPSVETDLIEDGSALKPFLEHLEDLRWTLIKIILSLAAAMFFSFFFARQLLLAIIYPLKMVVGDPKPFLRTLQVTGGFTLALKLALYAGLIIACPFILYFLAQFLLPALTRKERRMLAPAFIAGALLFLAGCALCYFAVLPAGLRFFIQFNDRMEVSSEWTIENYVGFVSQMLLAFGICFELPLVVLVLAKIGIVTYEFMRQKRPHVFVAILVVAAFITPTTDPVSMFLLAMPMYILFEACIWITWWMERKERLRASN